MRVSTGGRDCWIGIPGGFREPGPVLDPKTGLSKPSRRVGGAVESGRNIECFEIRAVQSGPSQRVMDERHISVGLAKIGGG